MTSMKKLPTTKFYNLSRSVKFILFVLPICLSHIMVITLCTNLIHLSCSVINYEKDICFMNKLLLFFYMKKLSIYKLYILMSHTNL
jgi:hypothetical protein